MSDYLQPSQPELVPDHLVDPQQKKAHEQQARQELTSRLNEIQREIRQNPGLVAPNPNEEQVYVQNMRPFAIQVSDQDVSISGELTKDSRGPFQLIARRTLDSSMSFVDLMTPDGNGRAALRELDRDSYQTEFKAWQERKRARLQRENDRELTDAEIERRDDFKVRPDVALNTPVDQS